MNTARQNLDLALEASKTNPEVKNNLLAIFFALSVISRENLNLELNPKNVLLLEEERKKLKELWFA